MTAAAGGDGHQPGPPSWDCLACEQPWPCDPAREHLTATMAPSALAMYAWVRLEQAGQDLAGVPPAELWERFLAWTRPPP